MRRLTIFHCFACSPVALRELKERLGRSLHPVLSAWVLTAKHHAASSKHLLSVSMKWPLAPAAIGSAVAASGERPSAAVAEVVLKPLTAATHF